MPINNTPSNYRNEGLEMAAILLIRTAEDIEEMIPRRQKQNDKDARNLMLWWRKDAELIKADEEKAKLLRYQALRVRELKT